MAKMVEIHNPINTSVRIHSPIPRAENAWNVYWKAFILAIIVVNLWPVPPRVQAAVVPGKFIIFVRTTAKEI